MIVEWDAEFCPRRQRFKPQSAFRCAVPRENLSVTEFTAYTRNCLVQGTFKWEYEAVKLFLTAVDFMRKMGTK